MATTRTLFSVLCILVLSVTGAFAGTSRSIDLDAEPEAWQGTIIAVVEPTAKAPVPAGGHVIHELLVERVLYGSRTYLEGATIPVTSYYERASGVGHPAITLDAGKHYILIMRVGPGVLIYGDTWMNLGPLHSVLPVTGKDDQVVNDIKAIIDTASCHDGDVKERRLQELKSKEMGHPLIAQYVLQARVNLAKAATEKAEGVCLNVLYEGLKQNYEPAMLVFADRQLVAMRKDGLDWFTSADRKKLFTVLSARLKPDDPDYAYVQEVLKTFNTPPAEPAE